MLTLRRISTVRPYKIIPRTIHRSCIAEQPDSPKPFSHGAENYFVDSDDTPPPNASIYKVDATSDAVESAYEPPSGPWSRAGAGTDEYQSISKDVPYDVPNSPDAKLRYGGRKGYVEDKSQETSKAGEGPEGTGRWGRKSQG